MIDVHAELISAMLAAGVIPKNPNDRNIALDGKMHRFQVERDKGRERTGWVVGHSDGVANATFGDWRHDEAGVKWVGKLDPNNDMPTVKIDPHQRKKRELARADEQRQASETARQLWERARSADPTHGYLQKKNIPPFGLKQDGDALLVPYRDISTNEITTVQRIFSNGDKQFFAGATTQGAAYIVSGDISSGAVLLCEGMATAHSLNEMTELTCIACGSCHSVKSLSKPIAAKYRGRRVIVCADDDAKGQGVEAAKEAVRLGGLAGYIVPPFGVGESGSDYNDLAQARGLDGAGAELQRQIEGVLNRKSPLEKHVRNLDHTADIPKRERIAGLFPTGFLSKMISSPGVGKTWIVEKLACDLSTGGDILSGFSCSDEPVKSLIMAGEAGNETLVKRLRATMWNYNPANIAVFDSLSAACDDLFLLLDRQDGQGYFRELLDTHKPQIVFIDTLSSFHESDENKAYEMKPIFQFLARQASERGISIVLCHHCRKSDIKTRLSALHQDESVGSGVGARLVASMIGLQARDDDEVFVTRLKGWDKSFPPFSFKIGENPQTGRVDLLINLDPVIEAHSKSEDIAAVIVENFDGVEWFKVSDVCPLVSSSAATVRRELSRLVDTGKLERQGANKNAEYRRVLNLSERSLSLAVELSNEKTL